MHKQTTVPLPVMHIPFFARFTIYLCSFLLHVLIAVLLWYAWHIPEPHTAIEHPATHEYALDQAYQYQQAPIIFTPTIEHALPSQDKLPSESSPEKSSILTTASEQPIADQEPIPPAVTPEPTHTAQYSQPIAPASVPDQHTASAANTYTPGSVIKRHIDFTDVAKGFLSFSSTKKGRPPLEQSPLSHVNQIKFERFAQRMLGAIQNAFKLLKQSLMLPYAPSGITQVAITLAPDGMLEHARIAGASNNPYFDQFLLSVVKQGGSMFPPLPSGLEQQTQHMRIVTTVTPTPAGGTALSFSLVQDTNTS